MYIVFTCLHVLLHIHEHICMYIVYIKPSTCVYMSTIIISLCARYQQVDQL